MTWLWWPYLGYLALWIGAAAVILWSIHVAGDDYDEPCDPTEDDLGLYDDRWPEGWALCAEGHNGRCCVHSVNFQHGADAP